MDQFWNFENVKGNYEKLKKLGLMDLVYEAMSKSDTSDLVVLMLYVIKQTENLKPIVKKEKCAQKSKTYSNAAHEACKIPAYETALELYNKALMYAPPGSKIYAEVYAFRSALLSKRGCSKECLIDIETCLRLKYHTAIRKQLQERKRYCEKEIQHDLMTASEKDDQFHYEYFNLSGRQNPEIPCASNDIAITIESGLPKVIATNEVKIGTLLAIDQNFVGTIDKILLPWACYYCHKISLNLIPCDNCCFVMFCNERCKSSSMEDYHQVECQIMEIVGTVRQSDNNHSSIITALKAAIKLKNKLKTWAAFNEASQCLGIERMKKSNPKEMYNGDNMFSILNFKDDRPFLHGRLYNTSFYAALFIYYLFKTNSFFPNKFEEKQPAIRSFSRIFMYLLLNTPYPVTETSISNVEKKNVNSHDFNNDGISPLIGKLKHSCLGNVQVVDLNNKLALIAIQPLKPNTELKISIIGHFLSGWDDVERKRRLINQFHIVCQCVVCTGEWKLFQKEFQVSDNLKAKFRKFKITESISKLSSENVGESFLKSVEAMTLFNDVPFSAEYAEAFDYFQQCILLMQNNYCGNKILSEIITI